MGKKLETKCTQCVYAVNNNHCGLRGFRSNFNVYYCSAQNTDKLPNGFELQKDGYFSWVKKKPEYPKTYAECCDVLKIPNDERYIDIDVPLDYNKLISTFTKLLICRKAYWKIAGEEMELDKPWEPKYVPSGLKFIITTFDGKIDTGATVRRNTILAFPIEEMRDAFYENFKDLIELCKEFLQS